MTDTISTRAAYRDWAAKYDTDSNTTRDLDAAALRDAGLPVAGAHVVELGAGTGKNTAFLADHAARITALDISPDMLRQARDKKLGDHITYLEADIRQPWPVAAGCADLVVSNLVLEHIAELEPVFRCAAEALKPGGIWHLSEFHPFRQMRGGKARYEREGQTLYVEAYLHMIEDFFAAAQATGFEIERLSELIEDGVTPSAERPPRLLVLRLRKT